MARLEWSGGLAETRPITPADLPLLLAFIREMAVFERMTTAATEESLHESFFADPPAAIAELVFVDDVAVGYVIYYFTFGSMTGRRGLWLDDLYVAPAQRGRGLGRALMRYLAGVAVHHRCARFEWMVLDWNEQALGLYRSLGAQVLDDHRVCRLDEAALAELGFRPGPTES